MKNVLEKIVSDKKESLKIIKKEKSLNLLEKNIKDQNFSNFKEAIKKNKGVSIISEIKKASPSAGILTNNFNHLDIARMYIENGATCLSVLTEEKHFLGKELKSLSITSKEKIPDKSKVKDHIINLKKINLRLWDIEEGKRMAEKDKKFDDNFIRLSRDVYKTNDERAKIKLKINEILGSNIKEVKSHY
ncbi:hypothetical protein OA496_01785 [Pelagibacteraceae bacterium]|nr:hypothetical protein [Pelagibacteraceae bacterium]